VSVPFPSPGTTVDIGQLLSSSVAEKTGLEERLKSNSLGGTPGIMGAE
jgi:hypothetical protein